MPRLKHDDYIYNRTPQTGAALPMLTDELMTAYRIFGPGLNSIAKLDDEACTLSWNEAHEDHWRHQKCHNIMASLGKGRHEHEEFHALAKKAFAAYEVEIIRMAAADVTKLEAAEREEETRQRKREKWQQKVLAKKRDVGEKNKKKTVGEAKKAAAASEPMIPQGRKRSAESFSDASEDAADMDIYIVLSPPSKRVRTTETLRENEDGTSVVVISFDDSDDE